MGIVYHKGFERCSFKNTNNFFFAKFGGVGSKK